MRDDEQPKRGKTKAQRRDAPPVVQRDSAGRLLGELACVACGYNLRGLEAGGQCSECGVPVQWTLSGGGLGTLDPHWLAEVRCGAAWMSLSLAWLWCPLAWPAFVLGLWRMSEPLVTPGRPAVKGVPPVTRLLALVLLVTPLAPVGVAMCVGHLAKQGEVRRLRRCAAAVIILTLLAVASGGAALAAAYGGNATEWVVGLAIVAVPAGLAAALRFCVMLPWTWRTFHVAEAQSRALRGEQGAWRPGRPISVERPAASSPSDPVELSPSVG